MSLKTVRVPSAMEAPFVEAERHVSRYFRDRKDDPEHGTIEIFGERYILVRAASLSVDFHALVERIYGEERQAEADEFAQAFSSISRTPSASKSDARDFHAKMGLVDPIAKLSAGPIHFAHAGWAFVDISAESRPSPDAEFFLLYDHPYSFESDAWVRSGKKRESAACTMNAGYFPAGERAADPRNAHGETVLLVEDQASLRRIVREVLEDALARKVREVLDAR